MNAHEKHEISESNHRIINPFTDEKLSLLGRICRFEPGQRQLDLASGKGEMLCRWAAEYGIGGIGVDLSAVFVEDARRRAVELEVDRRVEFLLGDAALYQAQEPYDVVSCIGASWIGGGFAGTIELMKPALKPGGLLLVGEPYWIEPPPEDACAALHVGIDEFATLEGTLGRCESMGTALVEMVLADGDSWDRYEAEQWWAVERWLSLNSGDERVHEMREFLAESQRSYLAYGRRYLGWGVFVLRDRV